MPWTDADEALWQERLNRLSQCPLHAHGLHYYTERYTKRIGRWPFRIDIPTNRCKCGWTHDDSRAVGEWYLAQKNIR